MALKTCTKSSLDGYWVQCDRNPAYVNETININSVTWGRDTTDCTRAILTYNIGVVEQFTQINWNNPSGALRVGAKLSSNINNNSAYTNHTKGGNVCTNTGKSYSYTGNLTCKINASSGDPVVDALCDNGAGVNYSYHPNCTWVRTAAYKITPPTGLTVTWPSNLTDNFTASITAWSANSNIGGTPTSYPNHLSYNWRVILQDKNGNYIQEKTFNSGETKNPTLQINSANLKKNGAYKIQVICYNNMNQSVSATSGIYYTDPPCPVLTIDSCVYDPATKKCKLTFRYSKGQDAGGRTEQLRYDVWDEGQASKPIINGLSNVEILKVSDGSAKSGTITLTNIPTGTRVSVALEIATNDNNYGTEKCRVTGTIYAPVADAAFISFVWDDVRRTCTITATAPGAKQTRISAGYASNNYNVSTKLTAGETGTLVVKDLNHGTGQVLYLEAMPEAVDNHQYKDEVAKISIPIPNPILGIKTYPCGTGQPQEYIVDIIEHKTNNTCTPRWQNGDRVVKKNPC